MRDMTSIDLLFAVNELRNLIGGQIQKVYQHGKAVWLEIFVPGKTSFTLRFEPGKMFITEYRRAAPEMPENFAMFCRKHVSGQRITDIRQHGFDRIVEIETDKSVLIFEMFSKGNVIICDKAGKIVMPLEVQLWKDRQIVTRRPYNYPPGVVNPFTLTQLNIREMLLKSDKDIVRLLAIDMSLSGLYAEEVCVRAQIDKNRMCKSITGNEIIAIYEAIHSLVKEFEPRIVYDDSKIADVTPFEMVTQKDRRTEKIPTFLHALDEAYTRDSVSETEIENNRTANKTVENIERIATQQRNTIEKMKLQYESSKAKAEAISRNIHIVEQAINDVQAQRSKGESWSQIKQNSKPPIKEIKERSGKIILNLD